MIKSGKIDASAVFDELLRETGDGPADSFCNGLPA